MDRSFLLQTKFLVPRYGADLISRPKLLARLQTAVNKRLTLLSAPPGYGKTTLLVELSEQITLPYAWYQLDAADGDPTIFLSYLVACLRQIEAIFHPQQSPTLGQATLSLLEEGEQTAADRTLIVLINELTERLATDYLLILEDFHLVTNPLVHDLVTTLLDSGPPELHLIISSRTDPLLGLSRWRARGLLAEFRASDLRFAPTEVQKWLQTVIPGTAVETANRLNEKTEGWAAALQIILSALSGKDADRANEFIAELSGTQRFIFEYLAEEVLQQQTSERQQFLMITALLEQMNAAVCNTLLDSHNAQTILDSLEKDNLFIISLDEKRKWYRYHHLFREFLLAKLHREANHLIPQLENRAGSYYETQGAWEAAFTHFIRAQNFAAAARVLTIFAKKYVERGRVAVLQRYLSQLPEDIQGQHPELLLQHGTVLWRLGRGGTAVARYQDAHAAFSQQGDQSGVCRVLTQMSELARSQGDYRRAQELAAQALQATTASGHAHRAIALMALAKSEGFLTSMDRGRELGEASVIEARRAADSLSKRIRANLLRSLGHICWWHGDPQATLRYCQEALELVADDSPTAAHIYLTMTTPYIYWHDLDQAQQYAERGLHIAQRLQLSELLTRANSTLGSILSRGGHMAQGEERLRQAVELAQDLGLESYARVMAVGYLAQNLAAQRRIDEARQLVEAVLWQQTADPHTYEMIVCRSVLADIALEEDDLGQAQTIFESLLEIGQRRQFRIPLAMIYFGLAYIHLRNGRTDTGIHYGQQSVAILEPLDTWQLYFDQGQRARLLCQALVQAGQDTPFVQKVLQRLSAPGIVETNGRETAVRVQCLGPFRVFVRGTEITATHWVSTKARDMLAYFITHRQQRIPLDKATVDIWPDSEQQGRAFHSALYRLRQALRQDDEKAKFILVQNGEYWLDAQRFAIDVDDFETAVQQAAQAQPSELSYCLEQAIQLYQGSYMSNLLYYDWIDQERQQLQTQQLQLLCQLAHAYADQQNYQAALKYISQAISTDPLRENYYCAAMTYHAAQRDRSGLLRCYQSLTQELQRALNLSPSPSTQQQYQQLLAQLEQKS